jgi:predicted MFS family arabinose efflux permease
MAASQKGVAARGLPAAKDAVEQSASRLIRWVEALTGGPARFQIIFVLSSVLGLDAADKATVSAVTGSIKSAFHVGNASIGLLVAIVSFVGAIGTLPAGSLIDRASRKWLLIAAVALWSAAEAVSGFSTSFLFLLGSRVVLGAVVACAFPAVASLTGDFFPARDRARIYGLILAGELIGTGIGFFISGEVSSYINWHVSFWIMAALGLVVIWELWRFLPEPARGGQSWIDEGQEEVRSKEDVQEGKGPEPASASGDQQSAATAKAQETVLRRGVEPRKDLVLHENPVKHSLWWAILYVLRIPTYALLIIATALAYYFFSGVRAFAMIYLTGHYDVSRSTMSALAICFGIGALLGMVAGGHASRWLLNRGWVSARVIVGGIALFVATLCFGVGIWFRALWIGIPALSAGAFFLALALPPIDAARLDIMHPLLWGRAEAGSMAARALLEGGAPLLFGVVSQWLGGGVPGLKWTFLIMLIPLLIASSLAIPARRTYPRDVATAGKSVKQTIGKEKEGKRA